MSLKQCNQTNPIKGNRLIPHQLLDQAKYLRKSQYQSPRNVEQGALETSNVLATPGRRNSSTTTCFTSCIGTYDTEVEYDVVLGDIRMTDAGKVFMSRLKESFFQRFKEHLHLTFSEIPMNLQKAVIHDMEIKFGTGWSFNKIKKTNELKLQEILVQPNKKDKTNPPELRNKRRTLYVSVKVWKELIKAYDKVDAKRKSDEESTQVFEFSTKIISKSLNSFYILLVHY